MKRNDRGGTCSTYRGDEKCIFFRIPEMKRPLRRLSSIWEDNFKLILKKKGMRVYSGFNWLRICTSCT
jgi:hypothetical protein